MCHSYPICSQLVETGADAAVDHRVAHLGDDAAEHRRVDDDLDLDVLARGPAQGLGQAASAGRRRAATAERTSATTRLLEAARPLARGGRRWPGSSRARPAATTTTTSAAVTAARPGRRAGPRRPPRRRAAGTRGVGQDRAQLVGALEGPGEAEQLVLDRVELALGARHLEEGLGVAVDAVVGHRQLRSPSCPTRSGRM